jgi:hypothetical protein
MVKRSRPANVRKVDDKRPQAPLPNDGKFQATCEEAQALNDKPAAERFFVEDEEWIAFEQARSRLKEALRIDDDDFCTGILGQLKKLTNWGHWADQDDFNFVLSVLKDARPIDKFHALLNVQMAVCYLCAMRQTEVLLKSVRFELPADFQSDLHFAKYDASRLDKQKIRVDDLPVRQSGTRAVRGLMQTYVQQFQTSAAYRRAMDPSVKGQPVYTNAGGQELLSDGTKTTWQKTQEKPSALALRKLNGSHRSAESFTDCSKQTNSITARKGNGHASS